jgi:HK97 family phage prohead protease
VSQDIARLPRADLNTPRFTREGNAWRDHVTGNTIPRLAGADPAVDEKPAHKLQADGLVRAVGNGLGLRDTSEEPSANPNGMPTLFGFFARFNVWTEIDSYWEGNFLESIAPGAFRKTFKEQRDSIRCLFQHGHDPQCGDKPLGPNEVLEERTEGDEAGAYYEVPLLDTQYVRELIPGLEEELYGASFRMRVIREDYNEDPGVSDHNPKGLPERVIKEIRLYEYGPVTFPAYPEASAGVRSLTDEFIVARVASREGDPDRLRSLLSIAADIRSGTRPTSPAPSDDDTGPEPEAVEERRDEPSAPEADDTTSAAPSTPLTPLHGTDRSNTTRRGDRPWLLP